ncbi:MAG: hypothetical protein WCK34_06095 [Bacteroidota bacterium]
MRKRIKRGLETALEQVLTNSYKSGMISYMATHPEDFEEAIQLAISYKQPYSCRAAWLLWSIIEVNDPRIKGSVKDIIGIISIRNDDHQRELLKILQHMELNEEYEGLLFNFCATVWKKIKKKPSVRLTAFKMMVKIAKNHPGLSREIILLAQDPYMVSLSASAKKSVFEMICEPYWPNIDGPGMQCIE